ncbi:hypothetical protein Tco_0646421, partial [Tanacetum coccineum]
AEKYTFKELDQDVFQQDNVVDAEDYTHMNNAQDVDEEVVDREEHVVEVTQEPETVDESDDRDMNAIDFDEFNNDEDIVAASIVEKRKKG